MIRSLFVFFAVGLATLIGAGIVLAVLGVFFSITIGITGFLLTKVAPILLLGWGVLWFLDRRKGSSGELSAADREWLESGS